MSKDFKLCLQCGDTFFKEDIDSKGLCKCCNGTHQRFKINETGDIDL